MKAFRKFLQRTPFYGAYKALGHYPDYWYWQLRGQPIRSPHLLKQRTVRDYARRYGLRVLVESGTYYGEMVAAMKTILRKSTPLNSILRWRSAPQKNFPAGLTFIFSRVTARRPCRSCSRRCASRRSSGLTPAISAGPASRVTNSA